MTKDEQREQHRTAVMDFRYGIVADLALADLAHGQLQRLMAEKAGREYRIPGSDRTTVSVASIKKWLRRYEKSGKLALKPRDRSDSGKSRAIPEHEIMALIDRLTGNPRLTAIAAWRLLQAEGRVSSSVTASTLSRIIQSCGMSRQQRLREAEREQNLKFDFFDALECVQADCLHGPKIPGPDGKPAKAILIAFIDDATRYIVYSEFAFSEESLLFERGLKYILSTWGKPIRMYVDNGATFVSRQTRRILDIAQVHLIHSRPLKPRGRGKIERFFRTVRDGFLRPLDIGQVTSCAHLNTLFRTWLETEYHRSAHRGLGQQTPLEAWADKCGKIRSVDYGMGLDELFMHVDKRRVYNDSTVTIKNILFEVPSVLIGKRIQIKHDPHRKLTSIIAVHDGKEYRDCRPVDTYANTRVRRAVLPTGDGTKPMHPGSAGEAAGNVLADTPVRATLAAARAMSGGHS
jgi:transposase